MNMQAIVVTKFGDETVLEPQSIPVPDPQRGEVRVKLFAAGVNPVESYIRAGDYPRLPALPYTPGTDGAGIIDAVGEDVGGIDAGDRVFVAASLAKRNTGTYAQYVACDAAAVQKLPDSLLFEQGAGIGTPGLAPQAIPKEKRLSPGSVRIAFSTIGKRDMPTISSTRPTDGASMPS